jgi:Family of unknown function (DUF6459)
VGRDDRAVTIAPPDPAADPARPRLRTVHYEPGPREAPARVVPPPPPRPEHPSSAAREFVDAHHGATRILRLALEVLAGRRSHVQLAPHFAPEPLRYWRALLGQRLSRTPVRRGRMHLCMPRSGVAEIAVPCEIDGAVRALAARFERTDGHWHCTAVRLLRGGTGPETPGRRCHGPLRQGRVRRPQVGC